MELEERTNGEYGSRSRKRHKWERENNVRGNAPLSTPKRGTRIYGHHYGRHYISITRRHHHNYHDNHHQRKREREYMIEEFKKEKPPTVDGQMKNSEDAEAWLLGMKKLFRIHEYLENMK